MIGDMKAGGDGLSTWEIAEGNIWTHRLDHGDMVLVKSSCPCTQSRTLRNGCVCP